MRIEFDPLCTLDLDLPAGLAQSHEPPAEIETFWPALQGIIWVYDPDTPSGIATNPILPATLHGVSDPVQAFWAGLRPALKQVLDQHPHRNKLHMPTSILADFSRQMSGRTYDPAGKQSYAVWILDALFDFMTEPGKFLI